MKGLFIFLVLVSNFLFALTAKAQGQGWQWANGSTGGSEGYGLAVDAWGNVYTSGYAAISLDFGTVTLSGFGACAAVVVKYDASGKFLWGNSTHNGFARPINIAVDVSDNLYLLGYYHSATLAVGSFTLSNPATDTELFLAKFSPAGDVVWARNLCAGNMLGNIAVSGKNIYLSAYFNHPAVTLGPFTLTNADPTGNTDDIIYARIDSSGAVLSAVRLGGTGEDNGYIAIAPSGKVYMAGTSASPTISFGATTLTNTDTSLFVAKFDTAGNAVWAKNQQGIGKIGSFVGGVATDSAENVFIVGDCRPAAYFGTRILPPDSVSNVYLVKYDSSGSISWVSEITGNGELGGSGITTDNCGNVWICGGMGNQEPGYHGSNYLKIDTVQIDTPVKSRDPMFILEWNSAGTYIKSAMLPTSGDDLVSIAADGAGNIYIGGDYWLGHYNIAGTELFDPVQPSENILVVKYVNNTTDTTVSKALVCMKDSAVLKAPTGYTAYRWSDGNEETTRRVYTPGTYKLYCTGQCGGGIQLEIFNVNYGELDTTYAQTDTSICRNAHAVLVAPQGFPAYLWSNGDTTSTDTITATGTYWAVAAGTCTVPAIIDTFHVTQNNIDLAFSLGNDTNVCAPLVLSVPLSGISYSWQDGTAAATDIATQTGLYYVTVSEQDCFNTDSISVNFLDLSQHLHDTVLCQERPVQLLLTANVPPGAQALWSTGSAMNEILVTRPGTYWVTVSDDACTGTDTMKVTTFSCACAAIFPSAFTPNDDGKNDAYYPILDKLCDIFDYTFCIYNRWGDLVFVTHDPADKWNGRYRNIPQDQGMFMYMLEYRVGTVFDHRIQKGEFTLIR